MAKKNNIKDISRRRFIKKVVFAGAGTTLLPGTMFANGKESTSTPKNSPPLLTSPCLVKPTSSAITVNIVGDDKPIDCFIRFKEAREEVLPWQNTEIFSINKYTPFNISLNSLKAGTDYEYQVHARVKGSKASENVTQSSFTTQRTGASPYSYAMIADSHITPNQPDRLKVLSGISRSILDRRVELSC